MNKSGRIWPGFRKEYFRMNGDESVSENYFLCSQKALWSNPGDILLRVRRKVLVCFKHQSIILVFSNDISAPISSFHLWQLARKRKCFMPLLVLQQPHFYFCLVRWNKIRSKFPAKYKRMPFKVKSSQMSSYAVLKSSKQNVKLNLVVMFWVIWKNISTKQKSVLKWSETEVSYVFTALRVILLIMWQQK